MSSIGENIARGALGMLFLVAVCYVLSNNRKAVDWKLVGMGIFAQVMFALGVLNTTVFGQPVFWIIFGIALIYIIFNRAIQNQKKGVSLQLDGLSILYAVAALAIFFFGAIRSQTYSFNSLALTGGLVIPLILLTQLAKKNMELMKWTILTACMILTICVYTAVCPPAVFRNVLSASSDVFVELIDISHKGTEFIFGELANASGSWAYIFGVQVLPNIIFFAALSSVLYYLGILQKIVFVFAYVLNKLNISGSESVSTAANIFLGQTEAPLMIRPYLEKMTRSEILCIMIGGMANTAGSVLAAYVNMLGGNDPVQQKFFALHMLSQSIMSAPAAIVCSKILFPQTEGHLITKELKIPKEKLGDNFLDALSLGTTDGLKLAVNVGAMLIVFTALMWLANSLLLWVGDITHLNPSIAAATDGRYKELSLQMILGYVFAPVAWLIGVAKQDMLAIGQLLGEKTILNEFVAYISLGQMKSANVIQDPKSLLIATYALSGFANFASIGIQIGGISQLAPNQRKNLTELGVKALVGGTIACLMCACIAGALFDK
ncbi:CNT family concentrative nucleoside transporter [Chitinophaga skermanii]|uniref:CNT family concentrative nucleoside transporter n=1 Tax=Chitinophaga skermanii TaxID=331697 RepID=A0A327QYA0_9BACT|nr:nucleoside transporter C-terminal domain-containing protein [Chitinophaga skermanii]RAJ08403.1 CNT family concentrative nucleoside transporter [Chitinophaga skermanii]